jgi:aspartyl/asparaginyl-tRNA synthetase
VPASGACENVDTLFEISVAGDLHWFQGGNKRAYFAQTGQLYLESLLGEGGLPKLYCVGPSARAEEAVDTRHLTEFEMVEIEFRGSFSELLGEIERFINRLVDDIRSIPESERSSFGVPRDLSHLEHHPRIFPKIRYEEAIQELGIAWGKDISSKQEQQLIQNHGRGPVFITHFPNPMGERMQKLFEKNEPDLAIKFFNMLPEKENPDYVLSSDCIVPFGGECVGSASRVYTVEEFRDRLFGSLMFKRLASKDPNAKEGFGWYMHMLETFPSVPHAGCGFGMSRISQYLLAQADITKAVVLPSNRARLC